MYFSSQANLYGIKALLYCLLLYPQQGEVSITVGDQMKDFFFFCDINLQDTGSFEITSGSIDSFICFFHLSLLWLLHCWAMSFLLSEWRRESSFVRRGILLSFLPLSYMVEEENDILMCLIFLPCRSLSRAFKAKSDLPYSYEQVR